MNETESNCQKLPRINSHVFTLPARLKRVTCSRRRWIIRAFLKAIYFSRHRVPSTDTKFFIFLVSVPWTRKRIFPPLPRLLHASVTNLRDRAKQQRKIMGNLAKLGHSPWLQTPGILFQDFSGLFTSTMFPTCSFLPAILLFVQRPQVEAHLSCSFFILRSSVPSCIAFNELSAICFVAKDVSLESYASCIVRYATYGFFQTFPLLNAPKMFR